MAADRVLLFTDVEGSTQLTERLGDLVASELWTRHDRIARHLMRVWGGLEIDKSDGFLILFERVEHAVRFAMALHQSLGELTPPLRSRAGIHCGDMVARQNSSEDVTLGAKRVELDGVAKAVASRIMCIAGGGQTLLSARARAALGEGDWKLHSHGHWRLKGMAEPIELFEVGDGSAPFIPPGYSEKAFRVVDARGGWMALTDLPHNIPAERDNFVGRVDALAALALLFNGQRRLVTTLGIGGIGKTRLAIRYALSWLGDYSGGAWFCDLSPASTLDGIVLAVAQGLDVPLGKADPVQQLGAAIAGRGSCLVILDNFEQVARHAEATVGQWLERAPQARFLVTSREVLGIPGEEAFVLAPLPAEAAIQLFETRAKAAHNTFASEATGTASIAKLVELLDRLPLAIELAAARVRVMSPRVMLDRMDQRFKLLASSGGRRERQATLRATLDWSWDLLSKAEQSALAQLSVFEGGFALEGAEAVVELPSTGEAGGTLWLPDVVQALVQKSLLRKGGDQRFEMLRSVQDYAAERLTEGHAAKGSGPHERAHASRRHWTYFASLDEAAATADRCAERENLIAACRRAAAADDVVNAVGALAVAATALQRTGPFRAVLELVSLVEGTTALEVQHRAIVDRVAGLALSVLGEADRASARFESGLARAAVVGDLATIIRIRCLTASFATSRSAHEEANRHLEEAMTLAISCEDPRLRFRVWSAMGALCQSGGKLSEAIRSYESAIKIAKVLGDKHWQGGMYGNLGFIAQTQGRLADARSYLEAALECASEMGDRQWEGNARCNLGFLLYQLGDANAAAPELERALKLARSIGYRRLEGTVLCNLGIASEARSDPAGAIAWYRESIVVSSELGDRPLEAQFRGYLGLQLAKLGLTEEAEHQFDKAAEMAAAGAETVTLAMLHCQRAIAAAAQGDQINRRQWLARAEQLLEPDQLAADFELNQAFAVASAYGGL